MNLNPFAFLKKATAPSVDEVVLPTNPAVWSEESVFWRGNRGEKYNPDTLIGKKGFGVYRKMMLDEQVKAVVRFKRDAITSRDYFFEADKDKLGDEEAERRVAICDAYLSQMKGSFLDSLNGMMSSVYQGFSITEKCFKQIQVDELTYWGIDHLRLKPYDTFEFDVDDFGGILRLIQELNGERREIDLSKVIHHLNNPEYDEHYGQSELKEAYRPWFHKEMTLRWYGMWLERHAAGFKVVKPMPGKTLLSGTAEYSQIQAALSNSVNGASLILPGTAPAGQTGSFSQSDTQLEGFFWTLDADAARLEDTVNEQLFSDLGKANFGDDYWPRFRFKPASEKKKMAIITAWKELVVGNAVTASDTDEAHIRKVQIRTLSTRTKKRLQAKRQRKFLREIKRKILQMKLSRASSQESK